ncbi:RNA polymerase sigma-70 factor, ECF subfamily [Pedobacter sp. ok626]|uniref:RNA polymerase sigma factor n=1 Tax=Pedobacter sp. ok626 TaxID=1761882 RepID=UPI0008905C2D|nr:RNA polymerase sigma-70 factor [Pedobacter sp. ok626]SDL16017.1 RNA polymerase sigma-70 factor, ECF subfamily [Pedobacter sp. ok626]
MTSYSKFSDEELAAFLKGGDHLAFTEIYNRFFSVLYIHAYRRLKDDEEASDLIQEIFAAIWDKRKMLDLTGSLSSYLYKSIHNRILNKFTHKKVSDRYMDSLVNYSELNYTYADHKVRERDLKRLIEKEIDALPEPMRAIFILSRKEHLSHKEIAEVMDMTEQAVKSQVKRALKVLRAKLGFYSYFLCFFKLL